MLRDKHYAVTLWVSEAEVDSVEAGFARATDNLGAEARLIFQEWVAAMRESNPSKKYGVHGALGGYHITYDGEAVGLPVFPLRSDAEAYADFLNKVDPRDEDR